MCLSRLTMVLVVVIASFLLSRYFTMPVQFVRVGYDDLPSSSMREVSIQEGRRVVTTICIRCHYDPEIGRLSGRKHPNPERVGDFWSGNITQDSIYGIGSWTRRDLVYFLRFGVTPDGRYVFDMPKYVHLSDSDMSSLVSFLKSDDSMLQATAAQNPPPRYSLPMR